jgi:hypothetical protein
VGNLVLRFRIAITYSCGYPLLSQEGWLRESADGVVPKQPFSKYILAMFRLWNHPVRSPKDANAIFLWSRPPHLTQEGIPAQIRDRNYENAYLDTDYAHLNPCKPRNPRLEVFISGARACD